ncbi:transcriptional regulator GcvA [Shewanella sp. AS16]|uniref:transcriptional regulator GcvA n=1 Tax=Shewanella sp. AS16 TaxID=2907625 RepID=UPI001F1D1DED|nr:transcriptional regulator GcvA [Shewanella sp. AS16]MCE9687574.1 transcriptional regulator GcvA [Shewanella sp. AS16]
MRQLPPLNAIRAFEATARLGGVQRASEELHVTHGAVSRQLKQLETWLGVTLFDRSQRALTLNAAGRAYLHSMSSALDLIHEGTASLQQFKPSNSLGIATTHSFATKWLMDKLPAFAKLHPEIEIWLSVEQQRTDFANSRVDLGLRMGQGPWPGLHCTPLLKDRLIVVCSPQLLANGPPLARAEDLALHTLLHDQDPAAQWLRWFQENGLDPQGATKGPRYTSTDLLLRAAMAGQGVALVSEVLAAAELAQGLLCQPLPQRVELGDYFWLVTPPNRPMTPKLKHFSLWLKTLALS